MKKIAIVQSNYIPWKGYFDLIARADEFVLYDDMQYTRRDWRNRNKIKTPQGLKWLTVPVDVKGKYFQAIRDTRIADGSWAEKHFNTIHQNYLKAPFYKGQAEWLKALYEDAAKLDLLSDVNRLFISALMQKLGIETKLSWSSDYQLVGEKSERLAAICEQAGGSHYISGPAARDYLEDEHFDNRNIAVEWMDYSGYPEYPQIHGEFEHGVTVLDLLFCVGVEEAPNYMRYVR